MRKSNNHASDTGAATSDTGAILVELAIVFIVLAFLILGAIEFSFAYSAKAQLTGAVREGARAAALGKTTAEVNSAVSEAFDMPKGGSTSVATTPCAAESDGDATVTVTYHHKYITGFFGQGTTITEKGVMRCGL